MNYKSKLEKETAKILEDWLYEPFSIPYTSHRNYTPDFVSKDASIFIECKENFRNRDEARKYVEIKEQCPEKTLLFVIRNPWKQAFRSDKKRRKDGTKMTMKEWLNKHEFIWYTIDDLCKGMIK